MPPILSALSLWLAGTALAAAAWRTRTWRARRRAAVLLLLGAVLFLLPALQPRAPLAARIAVVVALPILALKLRDLHVGIAWWRTRGFRSWLWFLLVPFVLVLRRHVEEPAHSRASSLWLLLRGAVEVAAGVLLLQWAFAQDLGARSFWLDHGVKLLAAYLCAFDGGMVTLCALLRLLGFNVMDYSREPILSRTPAEFWRRYNRPAGRFFYEDVFKPAGGYRRPGRGIALTFLLNGLLHEYVAYMLIGRVSGYQLAFFVLHGAAVAATFRLRLRGAGALLGGIGTFLFLVATAALFFASVNAVVPDWLYPHGGLLP